jgi:predicted adenine nucleotide alpha hydrolase (AANH) superfamily ATPase
MKILLHICCAPCAVYPVAALSEAGHQVRGFFFNPNIHPYQELSRRVAALEDYAGKTGLPIIWDRTYDLEGFLRQIVFREQERCRFCYHLRLMAAAKVALSGKFEAFTSTLLYSKFQNHEMIRELGERVGQEMGISFYYEDFRRGWTLGVNQSKQMGLYRQQYCGCIFSERDRFLHHSKPGQADGLVKQ